MSNFQMLFMIISNQLEKKQTQNMTGLPASGTRGVAADSFPPTPTGGGNIPGGLQASGPTDQVRVCLVHPVLPEDPLKHSLSKLWGLFFLCSALVTQQCPE